MRKAAGIILLILVVFGLVTTIIHVIDLIGFPSHSLLDMLWPFVYTRIVWGGFFVAAGVLCLKRKYWGLCLATALFGFLSPIPVVVEPLLRGIFISAFWETWILIIGALISTIFICLRKSEWSES